MTTPGAGSPVQIGLATSPTLIWGAGQGVATLINQDTVNTVYVGNSPSIAIGSTNTIPIPPLSSIEIPNGPEYAVAPSGTAALVIVPGSISYSPGGLAIIGSPTVTISGTPNVEIAGQAVSLDVSAATVDINPIATPTGYIPAGLNDLIDAETSGTIPTSGSLDFPSSGMYDMLDYLSWDLSLLTYNGNQSVSDSAVTACVTLTWSTDSAGDNVVWQEQQWVWIPHSIGGSATTAFGSGPCHARYLQVAISLAASSTEACTVEAYYLYGTQRTLTDMSWNQKPPGLSMNETTFPFPTPTGQDDVIMNAVGIALTASTQYWYPLPLVRSRTGYFMFSTNEALSSDLALCTAQSLRYGTLSNGGSNPGVLWNQAITAGTIYSLYPFPIPRTPLYLQFESGSTAPTVNFVGVASP